MKYFLVCMLMTSFLASLSFAGEVSTECEMMSEDTQRVNTKSNLETSKPTTRGKSGSSAQ
jgi:hypothetical protein